MINENKRDVSILEHILEYCRQIEACLTRFGNSEECFASDTAYRNAVAMPMFQIGELSGRLSDDFKEQHAEIPWKAIRGMRNLFAHDYLEMDVKKIWLAATNDVPVLKAFCERELSRR